MVLFQLVGSILTVAFAWMLSAWLFEDVTNRATMAFSALMLMLAVWSRLTRERPASARAGKTEWDVWFHHTVVPGDPSVAEVDPDATWRLLRGEADAKPPAAGSED